MVNHKYTSFEVYDDLDGLPAIRSTINEARQTAKRMVEKHGQAWIYGESATHAIEPLHFVEFHQ